MYTIYDSIKEWETNLSTFILISGNELIRKENEIIIINDFNVLTKYFNINIPGDGKWN